MEKDEARVSVGLPVIGPADEKTAGYEIIKTELESAGLVVDDKAAGTIQESLEHQILEFILKVASDPSAYAAAGATLVGKELLKAAGRAAMKTVTDKLASSGKAAFANINKKFKERFPNRKVQIMVEAPTGVLYPLPDDDPDEAVAHIAADMEKPRQIVERFHHWENGQWMTADEARQARNKPK